MDGGRTARGRTGFPKGRRRAFTLIELLVVISIIVILVAILLPVAGRIRAHARSVACQSNLRQWGLLVHTYVTGNDGKFFYELTDIQIQTPRGPTRAQVRSWWYVFLTDFADYRQIWLCPSATAPSADGRTGSTFRAWRGARGAGYLPDGSWGEVEQELRGSYGVSGWVGLNRPKETEKPERPDAACWATPYVPEAANVPLVFDCGLSIHFGTLDGPPPYPDANLEEYYSSSVCMDRHTGGINIVFMDWSVRKVGLKQLWGLKWHGLYDTSGRWTQAGGVRPEDWPDWMRKFKDH